MTNLNDSITPARLKDYAGPGIFQRGEAYFAQGAVRDLFDTGDKVTARVVGTETYKVRLWGSNQGLGSDCTCPHAQEGNFCKHCVAVGLAFLAGQKPDHDDEDAENNPAKIIRSYLQDQPTATLINWLLDAVGNDEGLYRKLLLSAQLKNGAGDPGKTLRAEIDKATRLHGYVDYGEAAAFAANLEQLLKAFEALLTPEFTALLVELTEYAIEKLDKALEQVDDSDGEAGGLLCSFQELHRDACEMASPDPVSLAERLFRYESTQGFGAFSNSLNSYHELLGEVGVQCFRELAEQAWQALPPLNANESAYTGNRWRITQIMESLARQSGDIEAMVAIKAKDLTSAYRYLDIATLYQNAKQEEKALAWAERGLKEFAHKPDNRLREFLVDGYLHNGRHTEALALSWVQFQERPCLDYYQKLHQVAQVLGVWPEQRQRALALVEVKPAGQTGLLQRFVIETRHSLRVDIALWEQDDETAWQVIQRGNCRQDLKLTLAERLTNSQPERALALYRPVISELVELTNNRAYDQAIGLIRKAAPLMPAHEFSAYLAELRVRYKAKRNFIALLNKLNNVLIPNSRLK